jgi:hypothetical protein
MDRTWMEPPTALISNDNTSVAYASVNHSEKGSMVAPIYGKPDDECFYLRILEDDVDVTPPFDDRDVIQHTQANSDHDVSQLARSIDNVAYIHSSDDRHIDAIIRER